MCVVAEIDGDGVLGMDILSKINLQMSGHVREMQLHKPLNIRKINNEKLENNFAIPESLSGTEKEKIQTLLNEYKFSFSSTVFQPGMCEGVVHRIETGSAIPVKRGALPSSIYETESHKRIGQ